MVRDLPRIAVLALVLWLATANSATQSPESSLLTSTPSATSSPTLMQPTQTAVPLEPTAQPATGLVEYLSDLDATDLTWEFFDIHPKAPASHPPVLGPWLVRVAAFGLM